MTTNSWVDLINKANLDALIAQETLSQNIATSVKKLLQAEEKGDPSAAIPTGLTGGFLSDSPTLPEALNQADEFETSFWKRVNNLSSEKDRDAVLRAGRVSHFLKAVRSIQTDLQDLETRQSSEPELKTTTIRESNLARKLLKRAAAIGDYTRVWSILDKAWNERHNEQDALAEAISASDAVVHGLYESIRPETQAEQNGKEVKDLRVKVSGQLLMTVFYENRLETQVSNNPVLFIVAPYWGHRLVWNWLAFTHEIGHHVWRNVIGKKPDSGQASSTEVAVKEELFAHLTGYLLTQPVGVRKVWTKWLEEIFADIFGLLQIGPAAIYSMQHMFFALAPDGLGKQPPHHTDWLLRMLDDLHPMPYLRVLLNLEALNLIDGLENPSFAEESKILRQRINLVFSELPTHVLTPEGTPGEKIENLMEIGHNVIKIMLDTPLFALGKSNVALDHPQARRTMRQVFQELDSDKVVAAQNLISAQDWNLCKYGLLNDSLKIQHLLAALQYEFEEITASGDLVEQSGKLDKLSKNIITTLSEYGKERLYKELKMNKGNYYHGMVA